MPEELLALDSKEFAVGEQVFRIAALQVTDMAFLIRQTQALKDEMERTAKEWGYASFILMVLDVLNGGECLLLVAGHDQPVVQVLEARPAEAIGPQWLQVPFTSRKQLQKLLPAIASSIEGKEEKK
jgi:inorganic pyrophosphatase/exopolyphosphatase